MRTESKVKQKGMFSLDAFRNLITVIKTLACYLNRSFNLLTGEITLIQTVDVQFSSYLSSFRLNPFLYTVEICFLMMSELYL